MSLLLAAGGAPSGTTGSIATTLDGATAAVTGNVSTPVSGSISTTLAGATASITSAETFSGAISTILTGATAALTGGETFSGPISTTLAGATAALTGSISGAGTTGTLSIVLDGATAAITGGQTFSGSISAPLDGATVALAGSVSGGAVSGAISTTLDGASASITGDNGQTGGGGYDDKPKKRYFVEKDGKLLVFSTPTAAIGQVQDKPEPVKQPKNAKKVKAISIYLPPENEPEEVIDLGAVQEYARIAGLIEQYNAAYNSARYEALIALFEQMRDEEEVEMLLMAL